jgi:hypothetical protein
LHPPAAPTSSHVAIVSPDHFTLQFDQTHIGSIVE